MWGAYYYKIADNWTPAISWAPRWFSANSYPTLTDLIYTAAVSGFTTSGTWTAPTTGSLPSSWTLTSHTPSTTGSTFQGLFEAITLEKQKAYLGLTTNFLLSGRHMDTSQPSWVWLVDHDVPVEHLEVNVSGTWVELPQAWGLHDMFTRGEWSWVGRGRQAVLFGFDLQQTTTQRRVDNWQFLTSATTWSSGEVLYFEHPVSRSWIPIHPLSVRGDGMLYFSHTATGWVRTHYTRAVSALSYVRVRINQNVEYNARRVDVWNTVDNRALVQGITRKDLEFNDTLSQAVMVVNWFGGQTMSGLRDAISGHLRQGTLTTASVQSTITFPSSATGCSIRDFPQYSYVSETLVPEPSNYRDLHTRYYDPDMGCIFLNQYKIDHSSISSSGTLTLDTVYDNQVARAVAFWRVKNWTTTSSSLSFTSNVSTTTPDVTVYFARRVRVNYPGGFTLRKSFLRRSPTYRWSSSSDVVENGVRGMAVFEQ